MSTSLVKIKSRNVIYTSPQDEPGPAAVDAIAAGVPLQDVDLAGADLAGLDLTGGDFQRADLTGADLSGANLTDCNFQFADLTGADLTDATLTRADFRYATLNNVVTAGTDFSTSTLQGAAMVAVDGALGIGVAPVVASISRVLYTNPDIPAGNTVGDTAAETAFSSHATLDGAGLMPGDIIRVRARLVFVLDGVSLDVRVRLGGEELAVVHPNDTAGEPASMALNVDALVLTTGAGGEVSTAVDAHYGTAGAIGSQVDVGADAVSVDLSGSPTLTVTADKDAATADNDVTLRILSVELLRAN